MGIREAVRHAAQVPTIYASAGAPKALPPPLTKGLGSPVSLCGLCQLHSLSLAHPPHPWKGAPMVLKETGGRVILDEKWLK